MGPRGIRHSGVAGCPVGLQGCSCTVRFSCLIYSQIMKSRGILPYVCSEYTVFIRRDLEHIRFKVTEGNFVVFKVLCVAVGPDGILFCSRDFSFIGLDIVNNK